MNNKITVSADHLEHINERLVLLNIDTGHLVLALQAVQVDCAVSKSVLNAVIMALSGSAVATENITDQLDGILSAPQAEVSSHEL